MSDDIKNTALSKALMNGNYVLAQWLIEKGALVPTCIWLILSLFFVYEAERANAVELSSFLKVLLLRPMSPLQDRDLPAFLANLSPQHAELCTRGRQLRDRLATYLEQQQASARTHTHLPDVLEAMVGADALHTPE
jgi:hypothetical protein